MADKPESTTESTIECPYCKEQINAKAKKCSHCHSNIKGDIAVAAVFSIIVTVIATFGVIIYIMNFNQNAFAMCELTVCAYCAVSIILKLHIYKNTK